ncbi:hypothetical protein BpHYR1_030428 [Brachionus plicatilis]|uniref:Uncharacterized protein n=1 Tax=Brachionus plicatilis TaxID=10195 RepID=A0A3M7PRE5_BRAPC|nr:hypothetical protein BpHYR1_030428 [Brachionus plicatilis]
MLNHKFSYQVLVTKFAVYSKLESPRTIAHILRLRRLATFSNFKNNISINFIRFDDLKSGSRIKKKSAKLKQHEVYLNISSIKQKPSILEIKFRNNIAKS